MNGSDLPSESSTLEQALAAERSARLRLAAAHAATRVLATAISTDDAVHGVLADVCRTLGLQWAAFWRPSPAGDALDCKAIYQDPSLESNRFTEMARGFHFKRGVGLPGRVWDSREALWIADVRDDPNFPRAPAATEVGLRGGFGFPVTVDGAVMGVMEFFSSRRLEPNLELLETMSGVGDQIGLFVSRRNAELAMRESDAKFRAFTESIADAAFAIDETSRIVYANPAVERIFGYAPHELIGQSLTMLVPERMREAHRRGVRRYLVTGHRNITWEGVELPGLHRSGREVPVEISFGTYTIGDRRFFTGMVRDISDRVRQNEILQGTAAELETTVEELSARKDEADEARFEAEHANRAKSDFLAIVSHELRTPLTAIIGYTDLLLSGIPQKLPEFARGYVDRVRVAGEHLLELIDEMLRYSRVEANEEILRIEPVELNELLREVVVMSEPMASRKGLDLYITMPRPVRLETDPAKVRQILLNLISNAVKFTDAGEIEVAGEVANSSVLLRVRDTGIGIAPEHRDSIFSPFWQAETSATRRAGGTGLGLAVSRKLAQLLGGDIEVDSAPGRGSTFTFLLPRSAPAP